MTNRQKMGVVNIVLYLVAGFRSLFWIEVEIEMRRFSVFWASLLIFHEIVHILTVIETNVVRTKCKNRELSCLFRNIRCHNQYVCSIGLKISDEFKLVSTAVVIILWEKILNRIGRVKIVHIDIADCVYCAHTGKSIITVLNYVHLYGFIVIVYFFTVVITQLCLTIHSQRWWVHGLHDWW
jgi:hypothetical protein